MTNPVVTTPEAQPQLLESGLGAAAARAPCHWCTLGEVGGMVFNVLHSLFEILSFVEFYRMKPHNVMTITTITVI